MALLRLSNTARLVTFLILSALIVSVEVIVTRSASFNRYPVGLPLAVLFDLVFITTALFYWLVARSFQLSIGRVGLVALLMVRIALFILPEIPLLSDQLWPLLVGLVEGTVLIVLGIRIRTVVQTYKQVRPGTDAETAIYRSLSPVFGERIAGFLIGEGIVIYYALLGWRLQVDNPAESNVFSTHRQSGQLALTIAVVIIGLIESVVVHLLLTRWNTTIATGVTVVSAYGLLFFVADAIATVKRPSYLDRNHLHIRLGIRWRATVSRKSIAHVTFISEKPAKKTGRLNGAFLTVPNVLITFTEPIQFQGPYGIQRTVREFSFFVDDRGEFQQALQSNQNPSLNY